MNIVCVLNTLQETYKEITIEKENVSTVTNGIQ